MYKIDKCLLHVESAVVSVAVVSAVAAQLCDLNIDNRDTVSKHNMS